MILEKATVNGKLIGHRLSFNGQTYLIFEDQKGMPGIRCGDHFVPGVDEHVDYVVAVGTCRTCWYRGSDGVCICPKFELGYGTALADVKSDEVLVEDDEGWGFQCGLDFGCIHRKER